LNIYNKFLPCRNHLWKEKRIGKVKAKEKGKRKRKGSPVERVEAVAVAGGSKVCMSLN
jgi:hypothetical protein